MSPHGTAPPPSTALRARESPAAASSSAPHPYSRCALCDASEPLRTANGELRHAISGCARTPARVAATRVCGRTHARTHTRPHGLSSTSMSATDNCPETVARSWQSCTADGLVCALCVAAIHQCRAHNKPARRIHEACGKTDIPLQLPLVQLDEAVEHEVRVNFTRLKCDVADGAAARNP